MRGARLAAVCLAAVCCGWAQPAEKCVIRGRVVSAATGAPLKRAAVWVEPFSPTRGVNGTPTVAGPSTTTDAEGRFALENVEPGSYLLSARRTGYLDQGYGAAEPDVVGPPLKLNPGDALGDVTLKLTPQSLLYGKVLDEDGEPLPDANVMVYRVSYAGGHKQLVELTGTTSQADGSVVVGGLGPGRYYLSAFVGGEERDPRARDTYVRTYYPGTADAAAATPIEVGAGAELRGLAIRMRRARVFHIRGRAVNPSNGSPAAALVFHLVARDEGLLPEAVKGATTARDGSFEFNHVLPGSYRIQSDPSASFVTFDAREGAPARPETLFGRAIVAVTDSDVEDLVVPVGKGAEISGKFAGSAEGTKRPSVALVPAGLNRASDTVAQSDADGSFRFHNVPPDIYVIAVGGLPEGAYVKKVLFGQQDITNQNLDLTSGAGGALEIQLSPEAGEVTGTVRNPKGDTMPGALVQIWPAGGDSARSVKADESGAFRFRNLPPADYRIAAWEDLDDDLAEYPAFRARFESQAVAVNVAEHARQQIEVKAIGRDAAAAEAATLKP